MVLSLCIYVQIFLFSKVISHWIMVHLIQSYGLIFPWLHVQRPDFKIKPHSQVSRVRTSTYFSRGHNSANNCSAVAVGPWRTSHFITLCPSAEKPRPSHGRILCYCLPLHGCHLLVHLPHPLCSLYPLWCCPLFTTSKTGKKRVQPKLYWWWDSPSLLCFMLRVLNLIPLFSFILICIATQFSSLIYSWKVLISSLSKPLLRVSWGLLVKMVT